MMYYAIINGQKIPAGIKPVWVKKQSNGVMVLCGEKEREGVVIEGEAYPFRGKKGFDTNAPEADLVWEEETPGIIEQLTNAQLALVEQYERNNGLEAELTNTQLAIVEIYEALIGGE